MHAGSAGCTMASMNQSQHPEGDGHTHDVPPSLRVLLPGVAGFLQAVSEIDGPLAGVTRRQAANLAAALMDAAASMARPSADLSDTCDDCGDPLANGRTPEAVAQQVCDLCMDARRHGGEG